MRRPNSSRFALVARAVQLGLVLVGAFALTASGQQHSNKANWELADKFSAANLRSRVYTNAVTPHWLGQSDSLCYDWKDRSGSHVLPRRPDDEDEEAAVRPGEARVAALGTEPSRARSAEPAVHLADVLEGSQDVHVQRGQLAVGVGRRD